jgi:hypothetical protein
MKNSVLISIVQALWIGYDDEMNEDEIKFIDEMFYQNGNFTREQSEIIMELSDKYRGRA